MLKYIWDGRNKNSKQLINNLLGLLTNFTLILRSSRKDKKNWAELEFWVLQLKHDHFKK